MLQPPASLDIRQPPLLGRQTFVPARPTAFGLVTVALTTNFTAGRGLPPLRPRQWHLPPPLPLLQPQAQLSKPRRPRTLLLSVWSTLSRSLVMGFATATTTLQHVDGMTVIVVSQRVPVITSIAARQCTLVWILTRVNTVLAPTLTRIKATAAVTLAPRTFVAPSTLAKQLILAPRSDNKARSLF